MTLPTIEQAQAFVHGLKLIQNIVLADLADKGAMGTITSLTAHWSAGSYSSTSNHYGLNATWSAGEPDRGVLVQTRSIHDKGSHCWGRNTGNFGLALCAMGDGIDANGKRSVLYPKPSQVMALAYAAACLAGMFGLDLGAQISKQKKASNANSIWDTPGTILVPVLADHAIYAKHDGYYPDRWDIGSQSDNPHQNFYKPLVDNAMAFRAWIKAGELPNRLAGWLK